MKRSMAPDDRRTMTGLVFSPSAPMRSARSARAWRNRPGWWRTAIPLQRILQLHVDSARKALPLLIW
jgi:hypothetical protein